MDPSAGSLWRLTLLLSATALFAAGSGFHADQGFAADSAAVAAKPPDSVMTAFAKADQNGDRKLTLAEFLVDRAPQNAAKRDFVLFDQDGDGALNVDEFWSVPPAMAAEVRGPLPDPMQDVIDVVMSALDASLDGWNQKPDVAIDAPQFTTAFWRKFQTWMPQRPADSEADPDKNGKVTRDEARRFLEIQLGVRRPDGKLLRLPTGRVVNHMLYLHVDLNKNDRLERTEFIDRSYGDANVAKEFEKVDTNSDGWLSFDEWCLVPWRGVNDPVMEFRQLDTDFDAFVTRQELLAGTPDWKQTLARCVFPGFDLNRDGKLSLPEYQVTMQANMILPWQTAHADTDGDNLLSLAEFKFPQTSFPLLRMMYFRRLDTNENAKLDPDEYSFKLRIPDEFFVMNSDGTGWKSFFKFEGHPACGSPSVSPDGKMLAFDGRPQKQPGSVMYVMPIDGGDPQEVGQGMMPNWTSDGLYLACSRNSPMYGVWLLDLAGDNHRHLGGGWGAQASPDGKMIAFTEGTALKVYEIETDTFRTVLDGPANPYQQMFWNAGWSPDSRRLCFKGVKGNNTEVATVTMTGDKPEIKVHHSGKHAVNADFAWHPAGNRIVFAMYSPERDRTQLYDFDPDKDAPPALLKGQDEKRNNTDSCWTPDGKRLIVVSGDY